MCFIVTWQRDSKWFTTRLSSLETKEKYTTLLSYNFNSRHCSGEFNTFWIALHFFFLLYSLKLNSYISAPEFTERIKTKQQKTTSINLYIISGHTRTRLDVDVETDLQPPSKTKPEVLSWLNKHWWALCSSCWNDNLISLVSLISTESVNQREAICLRCRLVLAVKHSTVIY